MQQTGDDDGGTRTRTSTAGTGSSTGHARDQNGERSVPERSRTLSNGELSRARPGGPASLQYASTVPNGVMNQFINNSNISRMGASRSEDGHSSNRLHYEMPPLPTSSISSTVNGAPQSTGTVCAACGSTVTGQFVRALGVVFHKACFTCNACSLLSFIHTLLTCLSSSGLSLSGRPKVLPRRCS